MSVTHKRFDVNAVREAAAEKWPEILSTVAGIPLESLDGQHHPCPKCGGTDRFRAIDADAGALYCNQCFNKKNGDGFAAIQWLMGCKFFEALAMVAKYLNIEVDGNQETSRRKETSLADNLMRLEWGGLPPETQVAIEEFCAAKPPITPEGIRRCGGTIFVWTDPHPDYTKYRCIVFKSYRQIGDQEPAGAVIVRTSGKPFPPAGKREECKSYNLGGSENSWLSTGTPEEIERADVILDVEGISDFLAVASHLPLGWVVVTNSCGAGSRGTLPRPWSKGKRVIVSGDADKPGQEGQQRSIVAYQKAGAIVEAGELPYSIEQTHGRDLRDWLNEGNKLKDLPTKPAEDTKPRFVTEFYSSEQFLALDLSNRFLIKDVLVAGQPAVIGGRSKVLKTSIAVDLAISLGSGMPFLNHFTVEQVANVGLFSGESGAATIRETAQRVATSKQFDLRYCSVFWGFDLPKLHNSDHLEHLKNLIVEKKLDVVLVDPLYLSLLSPETASAANNLFAMGAALLPLSELAQQTGCTPILLHHFRKNSAVDDDEPCGLEELSQAGVAEWARQWILLERRSSYQADGHHELFMRVGGSAGHAGLFGLDVDEGILDTQTGSGRKWDVSVGSIHDAREASQKAKERQKVEQQAEKEVLNCQRLKTAMMQFPDGETSRQIRIVAGLNPDNFSRAIHAMLSRNEVESCEIKKGKKVYDGFILRK